MSETRLPETKEFQCVLARARKEARRLRDGWVEERHLLLGLILNDRNTGAQALMAQIELSVIRFAIELRFGFGEWRTDDEVEMSPMARHVLARARDEARILGHKMVNPGHLLLALLHDQSGMLRDLLDLLGVDLRKVRAPLMKRQRRR